MLVAAMAVLGMAWSPGVASADYEQVPEHFGVSGEAEALQNANSVAINASGAGGVPAGSLYVVGRNARVYRYGPGSEGEEPPFREAWGWDTVASGPDQSDEIQTVTVNASSGEYTLAANTAKGGGDLTEGSREVTGVTIAAGTGNFHDFGAFHVGDAISAFNIPPGTTIAAVDEGAHTLELSAPAEATERSGLRATETTAPIEATATAGGLEAALNALPGVSPGDVSVSGGPGDAEGAHPYEVAFEGAFAGTDVEEMIATDESLAGGVPSSSVAVATLSPGAGGYETCRPAAGDVCTTPRPVAEFGGEQPGNFEQPGAAAVDQATGNVYVLNASPTGFGKGKREDHLVEVFEATGEPVGEGFGEGTPHPAPAPSIVETPEKLHEMVATELGLAVGEEGTVYVTDRDHTTIATPPGESRVMKWEPETPGDYEHYAYAGQAEDIVSGRSKWLTRIGLVPGGLVAASAGLIRQYPLEGGDEATCSFLVPGGQLIAMAADPESGEVFYFGSATTDRKVHRLGPCDPETGSFEAAQAPVAVSPETEDMRALALNPALAWGPDRAPGALYAADREKHGSQRGIGDVFAPAKTFGPEILSQAAEGTATNTTTLRARIDPHGFTTRYRFQYLSEAQYEANEPDERQTLTLAAAAGLFGLAFEGRALGGQARADLEAGSTQATNLATATATATLKAAKGKATLHGALGQGTVIADSNKVTAAAASEGAFAVGQTIRGEGIPAATTITAVAGSELTLSEAATKSVADTALRAGTATLDSLVLDEGEFEAGQEISGPKIPPGTTVAEVAGSELTLSAAVEGPGSEVALQAGSETLSALSLAEGRFEAGEPVSGEGIPAGTTIVAVKAASLQISKPASVPGTGVAISSAGPSPLAVGERIEGPGIPPGTTIVDAEAGELTLSAPAEASLSEAPLRAGLPFDAAAGEVRAALEGLATIGAGNVAVSGGPGDETGSSPYQVRFTGELANTDLPELEADAAGLVGGPASATVATAHAGGGGFADAAEAPAGGATLGGGEVGTATAHLAGLAPDTAYRFRVLAESDCEGEGQPPCEATGAPAALRTFPATAAGLPDGRAYELVSPPEKHGGEVFPADPRIGSCNACKPPGTGITVVYPMQSTPDGDAVTYMGFPFDPEAGSAVFNSYLSRRSAAGWQTTPESPKLLATKNPAGASLAYGPGFAQGLIFQGDPQLSPAAPAGYRNLYLQATAAPEALSPLLRLAPPNRTEAGFALDYAGHSADFSRQFFAANDSLTAPGPFAPAAPDPGSTGRELYEWHAGALSLISVLPGNGAAPADAEFASRSPDAHAISEDGTRVYFEDEAGTLYVREIGKLTREVHDPGSFLAASPDGLRALLSDGCLYSLATASCAADLSAGEGGFEGIAGRSEDLSRVYFVDSAALAGSGENERGEAAVAGEDNLYLWRAGGAPTRFIATLDTESDWATEPGQRTAQASPGGGWLAFASRAQLTGYDNYGPACNVNGFGEPVPGQCTEVFLYDAAAGHLACVSCSPSGEAPRGPSTLRRIASAPAWVPQPRYLSDSGRLFFDSGDRLSPHDSNGRVEDVYEHEPAGLGGCARTGGCVALISSGTGTVDSNFLTADQSGANVFFTTRERLVNEDADELIDLYDAREGGGFASETETQRAECSGEACQPSPEPPRAQTPASAAFDGAGNVSEKSGAASRCQAPARRAQSLSRRAKKLRRNAKRVARNDAAKAARMRRKAAGLAKQARRQSSRAGRCRRGRASAAKRQAKRKRLTHHRTTHHDRRAHR